MRWPAWGARAAAGIAAAALVIFGAVVTFSGHGSSHQAATGAPAAPKVGTPTVPATTPKTSTPKTSTPTTSTTTASTTTTTTLPPTTVPPPPRSITAIGDSVMLGAKPALLAHFGPQSVVDAKESRQFDVAFGIIRDLRAQNLLTPDVVVHLGTNGPPSVSTVNALLDQLADRHRVVVLTAKEPRWWEAQTNDALAAAVAAHPNAVLADWHTAGGAHPEWFYGDGIHLNAAGAAGYTFVVAAALDQPDRPPPTTATTAPPTTAPAAASPVVLRWFHRSV